jgi:hypothetical protein
MMPQTALRRSLLLASLLSLLLVIARPSAAVAQPQGAPPEPAPWLPARMLMQDDRLITCGNTIGAAACAWKRLHRPGIRGYRGSTRRSHRPQRRQDD